ncbi:DUF5110 domain-containing protein [Alkaliphilus pronyensis]|uniref:DUF5110 domain-containing protein n=1 Tax=Alkaliphilus pronyensis TaxID=1482732 RepID=A0A6I0FEP9_9FIRM|nr:TIM-barrel domain-containing protein [Alkaliphilus pronyensis]KAB3534104.1 DUF5110 domain-containing protein [Alkaliphilus pronyensis]
MISKTNYGYCCKSREFFLHILFYGENIVRFAYSKCQKPPSSTIAVVGNPISIAAVVEGNTINSNAFSILIDDNLKVKIFDSSGNILSEDKNINLDDVKVEKHLLWEDGFYGMGEKYSWLNMKGTDTFNWNTDVIGVTPIHHSLHKQYHTSINFYIGLTSDKCYGIYFDNSYKSFFNFGKLPNSDVNFSAEGGNIDYYFIYDKHVSNVVKGYTYLTGSMPLPPKAFLGYQQCRWSYEDRDKLLEVACRMRKEGIPCDVLYLDIDYMESYKVFTIDPEKFNDFKGMVRKINEMGFKLVVIVDPGVKVEKDYFVYDEGSAKDYYIKDSLGEVYIGEVWPGKAVFPDFLRSEVRQWWGSLHKELVDNGVLGFWNDMNEPSDFTTQSKTLPEDSIHRDDMGNLKSHAEIHNLYGMLECEGTYQGLRELQPNRRPFLLTRAAFAGCQRYAALWTGDNSSVWEHLEFSLPINMNLGLSGYAFVGGDVGGFVGDATGELLARWTQVGAFTPLFRNHSCKDTVSQEPWCFGEDVLANTKKYIQLRYQLLPYLYSLAKLSSIEGHPILRPLFYHFQGDKATYSISDQYLFGGELLICPVLKPGATARLVYLPAGLWYDFWTGEKIIGGKNIVREAPIDLLPIYARAGAILPMTSIKQFVNGDDEDVDIHIYTGEDNCFNLYFDDGTSFDYEKNQYSEVVVCIEDNNKEIIISSRLLHNNYSIPSFKVKLYGIDSYSRAELNGEVIAITNNELQVPSKFLLKITR